MAKVTFRDVYVKETEKRFPGLEVQAYRLRDYYSDEHKLFFDCEGDPDECIKEALEYSFHVKYVTFLVVKRGDRLEFMSVAYRNPAVESLEHFMGRYETTIKPSLVMTLVGSDKEFIELLGFSYESLDE